MLHLLTESFAASEGLEPSEMFKKIFSETKFKTGVDAVLDDWMKVGGEAWETNKNLAGNIEK